MHLALLRGDIARARAILDSGAELRETGEVQIRVGYLGAEAEVLRAEGRPRSIRFRTPDSGRSEFDDVIRGEVGVDWATISDFVRSRSASTVC